MAGKDGEVAVGRGCRRLVSDRGVSGKTAGEEKTRCREVGEFWHLARGGSAGVCGEGTRWQAARQRR